MKGKFKILTIALVLVVVLLAVFAGSACTTKASADNLAIQDRYGQQGQNFNGNGQGLCNGNCDGTGQGNCNGECDGNCDGVCQGNCNGECDGNCDGACQGNCNGDCNGACNGTQSKAGNVNRCNGCPGACNGQVNN